MVPSLNIAYIIPLLSNVKSCTWLLPLVDNTAPLFEIAFVAKFKVYNFNTSWCGWSKRFQPEWDAFTVACKTSKNIEAVDVKCDDDNNKDVCNKYNVPGYPYVIVEVDGDPRPYDGERTSDAIMGYIKTVL